MNNVYGGITLGVSKKSKTFHKWLYLTIDIVDKVKNGATLICPCCGVNNIDFQYVGDLNTKIGYLDVWCKACLHGIHISRVKIPDGAKVISFQTESEEIKKRIPNYIQLYPY